MEFGIHIHMPAFRDFDEILRIALRAEEVGLDLLTVPNHFVLDQESTFYQYLDPITTLSAVAARTRKLRIGTCVLLLPFHHPIHLAEEVATLDRICNGRFFLGVGLGWNKRELDAFNIDFKERASLSEEIILLLRRFWNEPFVTHRGHHFSFSNVSLCVRPRQAIPIWLGATTEAGIRRAARLGDAWIPSRMISIDLLEKWLARYRVWVKEARKDMESRPIPLTRICVVRDAHQKAYGIARRPLADYFQALAKRGHPSASWLKANEPIIETLKDRILIGSPDEVISQIEQYVDIGVNLMILSFRLPGMSEQTALESLEVFSEKILPHFQA